MTINLEASNSWRTAKWCFAGVFAVVVLSFCGGGMGHSVRLSFK